MTDNRIIIDGVDVSTCAYHSSTPSSELCYMRANKCNENPNCYFKQHGRLNTQYNAVVEQNKSLQQEIIYYRKLLTQIKEIAEVSNKPPCLNVYDCSECANCSDDLTSYGELCMQYGLYKILQKCEAVQNGQ